MLARAEDRSGRDLFDGASREPQEVNLLVVNADQVQPVLEAIGPELLGGRYTVGFWLWELEIFPSVWDHAFDPLHEVWTPSDFCLDAISARSPIPVRKLPLPVEPKTAATLDREELGIPKDAFLFSFVFNYLSYFERKNPLAVIRAFRAAFGASAEAHLLLKTSQHEFAHSEADSLREAAASPNITLVEDYWNRGRMAALSATTDCYVSLHRSEGFGLTLAEAMAAGTPVIATPYSGVTEFFGSNTGFPVAYDLAELGSDAGPYSAGSRWAAPDEDHAAELMRRVVADRKVREHRANRGRAFVEHHLSSRAIGERMGSLLQTIRQRSQGRPERPRPS